MKKKILEVRKILREIKIGIFILIAVGLVFLAALSIQDVSFMKGSYIIKIDFSFAEGLRSASPVRFCGVNVGEVTKVEIQKYDLDPTVRVYAKIKREIKIPRNSEVFINSLSLFGEKYLEIIPPEKIEGFMIEEETVAGISAVPLFTVMSSFHKTMTDLNKFINEADFQDSLKNIVGNVEGLTGDLYDILEVVKSKEGNLGRFIYDDSIYQKTEEFIEDLKQHPWKLLHKPKEKKKRK